jgi:S1-C subfamily serine protease
VKYALTLLATFAASSILAAGVASPAPPGWLGLGYTYNATNTSPGRMVWLFIRQIAHGGPAERAGLKPQDVITAINGKPLSFRDELETVNFFSGIRQGQRVQLKISRGRSVQIVTIVAVALPPGMAEQRRIDEQLARAQRAAPK